MNEHIQNLLDYKHEIPERLTDKLSKKDIQFLYELFVSKDPNYNIKKLVMILSVAKPDLIKDHLLEILLDQKEHENLRIMSAATLNSMPAPDLEESYLKLLKEREKSDMLQIKLIKGLGNFGTEVSLNALNELRVSEGAENSLRLSRILLSSKWERALKLNYDLYPGHFQKEEKRESIEAEFVKANLFSQKALYGLKAREGGITYKCGNYDFFIQTGEKLDPRLEKHPQFASVIGCKFPHKKSYVPKMLIFLQPIEKGNDVLVFKTSGMLSYGGKLQKDGSFILRSVQKFASDQVLIRGKYENGNIIFDEFSSSTKLTAKRKPMRMTF